MAAAGPLTDAPRVPNDPAVEAAFQSVPDDQVAEILDGELFALPRPRPAHANATSVLGEALGAPLSTRARRPWRMGLSHRA
jgi:hypothetical protein